MTRRTLTGAAVAAIATALLVGGALRMTGEETSRTPTSQLVRAGLEEQSLARRTGEPTHYTRSERALRQALAQDPNDVRALIGLASLANTRHHFREGLALARRVRSLAPDMALAYGVMGDALVELGRFEAGYRAYEKMAELKPSIAAYARVAQVQAGLGESDSARRTIHLALDSAVDAETRAWAYVELGRLDRGDLRFAAAGLPQCTRRLARQSARARGLGRDEAARGNLKRAIALQRKAVATRFSPEFAASLGDLYTVAGQPKAASTPTTSSNGRSSGWLKTASTPTSTGRCSSSSTASICPARSLWPDAGTRSAGHGGERGPLVGARPKRTVQGGGSVLGPGPPLPGRAPLFPPRDDRELPRPGGGRSASVPAGARHRPELLTDLGEVRRVPVGLIEPSGWALRIRMMRMAQSEIHEQAAAYALDALDPEDRWTYERHLDTCDRCREEVATLREIAGELAYGADGRSLRRTSASESSTPPEQSRGRRPSFRCGGAGSSRRRPRLRSPPPAPPSGSASGRTRSGASAAWWRWMAAEAS